MKGEVGLGGFCTFVLMWHLSAPANHLAVREGAPRVPSLRVHSSFRFVLSQQSRSLLERAAWQQQPVTEGNHANTVTVGCRRNGATCYRKNREKRRPAHIITVVVAKEVHIWTIELGLKLANACVLFSDSSR